MESSLRTPPAPNLQALRGTSARSAVSVGVKSTSRKSSANQSNRSPRSEVHFGVGDLDGGEGGGKATYTPRTTVCPLFTSTSHQFAQAKPPPTFFRATESIDPAYSPRQRLHRLLTSKEEHLNGTQNSSLNGTVSSNGRPSTGGRLAATTQSSLTVKGMSSVVPENPTTVPLTVANHVPMEKQLEGLEQRILATRLISSARREQGARRSPVNFAGSKEEGTVDFLEKYTLPTPPQRKRNPFLDRPGWCPSIVPNVDNISVSTKTRHLIQQQHQPRPKDPLEGTIPLRLLKLEDIDDSRSDMDVDSVTYYSPEGGLDGGFDSSTKRQQNSAGGAAPRAKPRAIKRKSDANGTGPAPMHDSSDSEDDHLGDKPPQRPGTSPWGTTSEGESSRRKLVTERPQPIEPQALIDAKKSPIVSRMARPSLIGNPKRNPVPLCPSEQQRGQRSPSEHSQQRRSGKVSTIAAVEMERSLSDFTARLEQHRTALSESQNHAQEVLSKDYQLIRMLFSIELMDNTAANKLIRQVGEEALVNKLALIRQRFGAKRLNKEEFHHAMELVIGVGKVNRMESDMFFDMFDTNMSGGIDETEFLAGIRMTLHDKQRSLASYCRRLMDARAIGTVITMMEIELLLNAVVSICDKQYPGCAKDAQAVIDELTPQAHHSQVPLIFFRAAVTDTKVLSTALREMSVDAALPKVPTPPPSPTPVAAFQEIAKTVLGNSKNNRRAAGGGLTRNPSDLGNQTPRPPNISTGSAVTDPLSPPTAADKKLSDASEPVVKSPKSKFLNNASNPESVLDIHNKRFRADECLRPGQEQEDHPPEHYNPVWCLRNGVVWKSSDLTGPMTAT